MCVCVCVRERERECGCVCVCVLLIDYIAELKKITTHKWKQRLTRVKCNARTWRPHTNTRENVPTKPTLSKSSLIFFSFLLKNVSVQFLAARHQLIRVRVSESVRAVRVTNSQQNHFGNLSLEADRQAGPLAPAKRAVLATESL